MEYGVKRKYRQHPPQHGKEMRGKSDAIARFWAARLQRADHFFQHRLRRQGERHGLGAFEAFFHARVIVTIRAVFAVDVALESRVGVGAEAALDRTGSMIETRMPIPDEQPVIRTLFCCMPVRCSAVGSFDGGYCATTEVTVGCLLKARNDIANPCR